MAYKVKFDTGEVVDFQNEPTDADIDEVVKRLNIKPKSATIPEDTKSEDTRGRGQKILEGIGSLAGLDVIGKKIAGAIAPAFVSKENQPFLKEVIKKEDPTWGQVAGATGKLALTTSTLGTGAVAGKLGLTGAKALGAKIAEGGIIGGAYTALDNVSKKEDAGEGVITGALVGGAIPLVGAGIKKGIQKLGGGAIKAGQKIQSSLIRPTKADISDGFDIANIKKYGLGGNLQTTLQKTDDKLAELTTQLKAKIGSRPSAVIDLNDVAEKTTKEILSNKSKYFGDNAGVKRVLQNLADEIESVSKNGLVDLPEAQILKQAAGQKGAWVFGFVDPDAKATEMIYTKFYQQLKKEIEAKAPEGVKGINKAISDLIPISHAIIRRIPVAERNNVFSLTDIISGGLSFGNPKALGLFIANRLTKSGQFAELLGKFGEKAQNIKLPSGNLGGRIFPN
jgi:hypothetical protein